MEASMRGEGGVEGHHRQDTSGMGNQLEAWIRLAGAPAAVARRYGKVKVLHEWQKSALQCAWNGEHLVCAAPTSGGKSLVAEVLLLRQLATKPRSKAMIVLPYVSIVQEKEKHLKYILKPMCAKVQAHHGASGGTPLVGGERVAVCTGEKANAAINSLSEEGRLQELSMIFVDEIHMLGENGRGIALEAMLTKLKCLGMLQHVQVVGMSATIGGVEVLAKWLDAALFLTNFRPVVLRQHVQRDGDIFRWDGKRLLLDRKIDSDGGGFACLNKLCEEALQQGGQVLVFCGSRRHCETCAAKIALSSNISPPDVGACQALLHELETSMRTPASDVLASAIQSGVAWHHAGLTTQERNCIEQGYRSGILKIIFATSTLAAGVNLPANRVILYCLFRAKAPVLSKSQYCQMVGRAGRTGLCKYGDAYIVEDFASVENVHQFLGRPMEKIASQMVIQENGSKENRNYNGISRLLLESISSKIAREPGRLEKLVRSTFVFHQLPWETLEDTASAALQDLKHAGLVAGQILPNGIGVWNCTRMGIAVSKSGLPYQEGIRLFKVLGSVGKCVHLDKPAVLLFHLLTDDHPFQIQSWPEWGRAFSRLPEEDVPLAADVGVSEADIFSCQAGYASAEAQRTRVLKHSRFLAAYVLHLLLKEVQINVIEASFSRPGIVAGGVSRGSLQRFQQDSATLLAMAASMAGAAGWWLLESHLSGLRERLAAGVRPELVDLMRIEGMTGDIARKLYESGYRNVHELVKAPLTKVESAALASLPRGVRVNGKRSLEVLGSTYKTRKLAESLLQHARELIVEEVWSLQMVP
uniref:Uncharacterized protein n=1 Tax=Picocystis salinarum TaxID=88271 RepID=A0A6U9QKR8_9CHLO|mmetsp:Transcript_9564/g.58251  ORF Transcript_9564/g.58251 Transcript_9564/m.58251 type:complete len:812 (+) Transcript_9564:118-2553(+)